MKKQLHRFILCLSLFALTTGAKAADNIQLENDTVYFAMGNWCPFHGNCDGRNGFVVDSLREIFAAKNIKAEFLAVPFSRAIAETRKGLYVGILSIGKESAPDFYFSEQEVATYDYCYFSRAEDSWQYQNTESLKQRKTAVFKDGSFGQDKAFIDNPKNNQLFTTIPYTDSYMQQVTSMLMAGWIDTYINEKQITPYFVTSKDELKGKIRNAGCIGLRATRVGFSPDPKLKEQVKALGEIIDNGMLEIRRSGKLAEIMDIYGLQLWAKWPPEMNNN